MTAVGCLGVRVSVGDASVITEADTCRRYVLPKLYEAGWTDDQISEQKYFTDGRVVPAGRGHVRKPGKRADYLLRYRPDSPIAVMEAKAAYKRPSDGVQQAMEYVQSIAGQFVITLGPHGAIAYDGECVHRIAPVPTQAVDTVGAGDIYAGGFLYGITHGMDFARAGRLASMAASRVVSNMGPRLEQEEMRGVLSTFQAAE